MLYKVLLFPNLISNLLLKILAGNRLSNFNKVNKNKACYKKLLMKMFKNQMLKI